ncbi:hypothetical protein MSG28_005644 [Choristoneura fumiferana]|uniref:Uncharacterized protein n=1 Tax=Choristoneura fumiferana TaxID=7141 RepID=A0ACC0L0R0_CHOFU|nr:hypothetical protein MSG28_005644 [Choristoneura fumiferana]
MHAAASFSQRWARDNLTRAASDDELATLNLFLSTCNGDESEASRRARRYYAARGPGGLTHLWHKRHPDDEDILSSCQDALKEDPTPGEEVVFIDTAYPLRFSEVHVINTHRLKTMSLLLLHLGLYPWRRKVVQIHSGDEQINTAMGVDYFPLEGLPYEYGGKAGAMKDLNERKYYETVLKPETQVRTRHKSAVRVGGSVGSYDMITRTHSCRSLHRHDDLDEGTYGAYRTLRIKSDKDTHEGKILTGLDVEKTYSYEVVEG